MLREILIRLNKEVAQNNKTIELTIKFYKNNTIKTYD